MAIPAIIKQSADRIRKAVYGGEVQESLAKGLEDTGELAADSKASSDVSKATVLAIQEKYRQQILAQDLNPNKDPELVDLRGGKATAGERMTAFEQSTTAQFQQTGVQIQDNETSIMSVNAKIGDLGANSTFKGSDTKANILLKSDVLVGDEWYDTTNNQAIRWNGMSWVVVGAGVKLGEKTVSPENTTFFETGGKNLFNKNAITRGKYAEYLTGAIQDLPSYGMIKIKVLPNKFYTKTPTQQFPFYDVNGVFISGLNGVNTFLTPVNCDHIIMNFELADLDNEIQLELGNVATKYEPFKETLKDSSLRDDEKIVRLVTGKNLFDKSKAKQGEYVSSSDGTGIMEGFWASDYTPLTPGLPYVKNQGGQFSYYTIYNQYLGGMPDGTFNFTPPGGAFFGRFTVKDKDGFSIDEFQIEKGNEQTSYEPFKLELDKKIIGDLIMSEDGIPNFKKVAKEGNANKTINGTINSLDFLLDTTVEIFPEKYEEVVKLHNAGHVSLIGKNKRDTVIIDKTGDYYNSPLQVGGKSFISNMTVIANNENKIGAIPSPSSYALHADYNHAGEMVFEDMNFESYQNAAVGIGTHQDQTLIFRRCRFYKDAPLYDGGSLYFHNAVASGATNQKLIFIDCEIVSKQGVALKMDDANIVSGDGGGNEMDVTFIRCLVYSEELGLNCISRNTAVIGAGTLVGNIKLNPMSHGNNLAELNA